MVSANGDAEGEFFSGFVGRPECVNRARWEVREAGQTLRAAITTNADFGHLVVIRPIANSTRICEYPRNLRAITLKIALTKVIPMAETTPAPTAAAPASAPSERLMSLDAYRGFVMLLLAFAAAHENWWQPIFAAHPDKPWLGRLLHHFEHLDWAGVVLWDLIQPSFMFMVGVSMAFSYASRARHGQTYWQMFRHACVRALVLILLGVFLRSLDDDITDWTLEDVVTQIGLGYVFLFLLWNRAWWVQLLAATLILVAYWALFALSPVAGNQVAVSEKQEHYIGFYAHWNQVGNPAHKFDKWLLNVFPRADGDTFVANYGGYYTLNFIPSLATMIFGLMAGEWLRGVRGVWQKFGGLVLAATVALVIGQALAHFGVVPIVKRIWTPSFAIYSAGWCLLILAALYLVIDILGLRFWAWPAVVVGKNSIAMYAMTYLIARWVLKQLHIHLGERPFQIFGSEYQLLMENLAVAAILWLICYWMYRRQVFLRI